MAFNIGSTGQQKQQQRYNNAAAGAGAVTGNRPRFASAPPLSFVNTVAGLNADKIGGSASRSFYALMTESGRRFRLASKDIVVKYVPLQWQSLFLETLELTCDHGQRFFVSLLGGDKGTDSESRRESDASASSGNADASSKSFSVYSCIENNRTTRAALTFTLALLTFYLVYSVVLESLLEFVLPLYAVYKSTYWFLCWYGVNNNILTPTTAAATTKTTKVLSSLKNDVDEDDDDASSTQSDGEFADALKKRSSSNDDDISDLLKRDDTASRRLKQFQYLIYIYIALDLTVLLLTRVAFENSPEATTTTTALSTTLFHVTPIILLLAYEFLGYANLLSSASATTSVLFLLLYSARLFLCQGLLLIPSIVRPFFAYLSTYLAYVGVASVDEDFVDDDDSGGGVNKKSTPSATKFSSTTSGGAGAGGSRFGGGFNVNPTGQLLFNMPTVGRPSIKVHGAASLDQVGGSSGGDQQSQKTGAPAMGRTSRRISLPAGSLMPIKTQSNLGEARGMIAELLVQKDLPPNIVTGLKTISRLLNPNPSAPTVHELLANLSTVSETPFIGEQISLTPESINARRQSVVTWSTVTSATGLPTLEPEPNRPRSSSYWKQRPDAPPTIIETSVGGNSKDPLGRALSLDQIDSMIQTTHDGTLFNVSQLDVDPRLSPAIIRKWDFPIFQFYDAAPETILSRIAYAVFRHTGLFNIFKINKQKFFNFFHSLEMGYWDLPYHNRIHASDVLHALCYFTLNPVPALPDAKEGVSNVFSSLELLAFYTAAGMHDYDHPGRTNAFLVSTGDPRAILYNDRSVLENHHASSAWKLLTKSDNNFVENLDPAEFKRFRYIVMEAILATDLKRHFEMLMEFDEKANRRIDWESETDKLLVGQIYLKMADINSPTKPFDLHKQWTDRILEEFYKQGDEERRLGLQVSPYMDRSEPNVAKLQDSFLAHLVKPLAQTLSNANLLPLLSPSGNVAQDPELMTNIEENHKFWKAELGEVLEDRNVSKTAALNNESGSDGEMETIEEGDDENSSG